MTPCLSVSWRWLRAFFGLRLDGWNRKAVDTCCADISWGVRRVDPRIGDGCGFRVRSLRALGIMLPGGLSMSDPIGAVGIDGSSPESYTASLYALCERLAGSCLRCGTGGVQEALLSIQGVRAAYDGAGNPHARRGPDPRAVPHTRLSGLGSDPARAAGISSASAERPGVGTHAAGISGATTEKCRVRVPPLAEVVIEHDGLNRAALLHALEPLLPCELEHAALLIDDKEAPLKGSLKGARSAILVPLRSIWRPAGS